MSTSGINNYKDRREFVRVDYKLPVVIETADITIGNIEGILMNIGAEGVMLKVKNKLYKGLPLKLNLMMKQKLAALIGYVKWHNAESEDYLTGIIFDNNYAENNDKIVDLITEEIISEIKGRIK